MSSGPAPPQVAGRGSATQKAAGPSTAAAARRRRREADILAATRTLFEERGVRDAQIEDVARAAGINRAIIYRHFTGKEDLFALTLAGYLDDLADALRTADAPAADPRTRLAALVGTFFDFGMAHPAFVDCAQSLMRRPGPELFEEVSQETLRRLGERIIACLSVLRGVLSAGHAAGLFPGADVDLTANTLYASGLGSLQLARLGYLVKEAGPGVPQVAVVERERVRQRMIAGALAMAATVV